MHRDILYIDRVLKPSAAAGVLKRENIKGRVFWSLGHNPNAFVKSRPDLRPDDKRLRPRLGRVAVDVVSELIGIFTDAGRPLEYDEIVHAWGRLRQKRSAGSLSHHMVSIINAQQKREGKAVKLRGISPVAMRPPLDPTPPTSFGDRT